MRQLLVFIALMFSLPVMALNAGDKAPAFIGRSVGGDGGLFALSRVGNKPKVINFFWVGCLPCRKEIPLLAQKEQYYPNVDFIVVHAEADDSTTAKTNYDVSEIEVFINTLDAAPERVVLGSPKLKEPHLYDIKGFPYSVLLNADNIVDAVLVGFNSKTVAKMDAWLAQQSQY